MSDLKPCPFCGGRKFHLNTKAKGYFLKRQMERERRDTSNYLVRCTKCGAKGPLKHSEAEAREAWNTRTPDPRITQLEADRAELVARLWDSQQAMGAAIDAANSGIPSRVTAAADLLLRRRDGNSATLSRIGGNGK